MRHPVTKIQNLLESADDFPLGWVRLLPGLENLVESDCLSPSLPANKHPHL